MARPNTYNLKLCEEICDLVADGQNIKSALNSKDKYPTFKTWCNWKNKNDELFHLYVKAIQDKSESVLEEIDQILIDIKDKKIEYGIGRLLIDTLKWKAAKFYPKMFGDNSQLDITTKGEPVQIYLPENERDKKDEPKK